MAQVPQEQWDALFNAVMAQRPSRSPLRHLNEGTVGDAPDQVWDIDGSVHLLVVEMLARHGSPNDLALLREVAAADPAQHPDRQRDRLIAQAILADIENPPTPALVQQATTTPAAPPPLPAVYTPPAWAAAPVPAANGSAPPKTTGEVIGDLYTALEALKLADALPVEARAPLAALISVLQTKNGAQL